LPIAAYFGLGGRDISDRREKPASAEPVNRFGERVVETVADASDPRICLRILGIDAGVFQALDACNREILAAPIAPMLANHPKRPPTDFG
jgi:hypothetical protein